jgi:CHC2 zinc finger
MNTTLRHLAMLAGYGRGRGYLELRWRTSHGMRCEHFPISGLDAVALRARALAGEHEVYVGAAPRARPPRRAVSSAADGGRVERAGTRAAIAESWVAWADCDQPDSHERLRSFAPRPPLAIASGSGGTHAYWPLSRPVGPDVLEQVNWRLAQALDADRQSVDAARILRPAGTLNHKHAPARPVAVRWFDEGAVIDLAHLVAALPPLPARRAGCAGTVEPRDPRGDPLLAVPPTVYVPLLVGAPLDCDRKVACPFHEDRTPSLHAFGRGRGWRCFGCGACGSIFDLAARLWGLQTRGRDFRELRRRLEATFSVPDAATSRRVAHRRSRNKRY